MKIANKDLLEQYKNEEVKPMLEEFYEVGPDSFLKPLEKVLAELDKADWCVGRIHPR